MTYSIHGLYAITPDIADTDLLLAKVEAALQGGINMLQYRNKTANHKLQTQQTRAILPLCRQYNVPLIINDSVKLCLTLDADGVHLGADDGNLAEAFSCDLGVPAMWAYSQDVGGKYTASIMGWANMHGNFGAALAPLFYNAILGETPTLSQWNNLFAFCTAVFALSGVSSMVIDATKPITSQRHQRA